MKRILKAMLVMGLSSYSLFHPAHAQIAVGHEEDWLRTTYYSFSSLVSMYPAEHAAMKMEQVDNAEMARRMDSSRLDITLSNIKAGPIQEVLQQKWVDVYDMVAAPKEILELTVGRDEFQDDGQAQVSWPVATAKWVPGDDPLPSDLAEVAAKWTVERVLGEEAKRLKDGVVYSRYATFTVTLRYQGKTENYKAFYFFGRDSGGQEKALPEDGALRANVMLTGGSLDLMPIGLMHTRLREYEPLKQWLTGHTLADEHCAGRSGRFCCVGDRCGIPDSDLKREMAKPLANTEPLPRRLP